MALHRLQPLLPVPGEAKKKRELSKPSTKHQAPSDFGAGSAFAKLLRRPWSVTLDEVFKAGAWGT